MSKRNHVWFLLFNFLVLDISTDQLNCTIRIRLDVAL
jgi:hypothetical protein